MVHVEPQSYSTDMAGLRDADQSSDRHDAATQVATRDAVATSFAVCVSFLEIYSHSDYRSVFQHVATCGIERSVSSPLSVLRGVPACIVSIAHTAMPPQPP